MQHPRGLWMTWCWPWVKITIMCVGKKGATAGEEMRGDRQMVVVVRVMVCEVVKRQVVERKGGNQVGNMRVEEQVMIGNVLEIVVVVRVANAAVRQVMVVVVVEGAAAAAGMGVVRLCCNMG